MRPCGEPRFRWVRYDHRLRKKILGYNAPAVGVQDLAGGQTIPAQIVANTIAVAQWRGTAHALRHTFCTMLAERGVALEVIRELAGHVDVRSTQVYVDVSDHRKDEGIAALEQVPHALSG